MLIIILFFYVCIVSIGYIYIYYISKHGIDNCTLNKKEKYCI